MADDIKDLDKVFIKSGSDDNDTLDHDLNYQKKKHEITVNKMDSWFQNIIHPMILLIASLIYIIVCLAFRYASIASDSQIIKTIYSDLRTGLNYFVTAVISCIVTEFVQDFRKRR